MADTICGLWVAEDGRVHVSVATPGDGRAERIESFRPFAWLNDTPAEANLHGVTLERLNGEGAYDRLVHADDLGVYEAFLKEAKASVGVDASDRRFPARTVRPLGRGLHALSRGVIDG